MVDLMKHHGTVSAKLRATNSAQAFLGTVIYAPKNKGTRVDFSESGNTFGLMRRRQTRRCRLAQRAEYFGPLNMAIR